MKFTYAVLACLALCAPASVLHAAIEIEINVTPAATDDYLCWSPVPARIRLAGETANRNVVITSSQRAAGGDQGEVWFQAAGGAAPTSATFAPVGSLTLTLNASGDWQPFWIAGKQASSGRTLPDGTPVSDGKDTLVIVSDQPTGAALHQHPVMVRIRKNAESLSDDEIKWFLDAVAILHDVEHIGQPGHATQYLKYVKVHKDAFGMGIHHVPGFAPWHRTMLLSIERELQQIDSRVALPYWKFDAAAPRLFTTRFIGIVGPGSTEVLFDDTNPLQGWRMPSHEAIGAWPPGNPPPPSNEQMRRERNASTTFPVVNQATVLNAPNYSVMNTRLEGSYHDSAHSYIRGWLVRESSPRDPLFFLLHANVDRAWLRWQKEEGAFNRGNAIHYFPQGTYAAGSYHQGSFVDDDQWPWNLRGGNQGNGDPGDDFPRLTFALPVGFDGHGPSALPIIGETIDFMNTRGTGLLHNYSYDTIPFRP